MNTPPAFLANGTIGNTGPYDGIVTLNVNFPFQFTRPVSAGNYDAQRAIEHEMDEVLGLGSHLGSSSPADLRPQDLFSWKGPGARNTTSTGVRYFSINGGRTNLVSFNQGPQGDFGDWLSLSCPQAAPRVQNAFGCTGQSSDISSGSPEGINLDVIGYDLGLPITPVGLLGNISTRLNVGTGEDVLIGGFIIDGSGPKQLVLRALGPTLSRFGVSGVLQDPVLELHNSSGGIIESNDNWSQAPNAQSIRGYLQPTNGFESAILITLNPGSYTAIVHGGNNSTGVALVELYDTALPAKAHLHNISTRGLVQADPDVMIAGMMVRANSKKLIVRALGPTLANFGVSNPLADPSLELHDENGAVIASNDDWRSTQQAAIAASGYAPANDLEAAIIQTVAPGNYTAIVRGVNSTGVALVEIYALQ